MEPFKKEFSFDDIPNMEGKVVIVTGGATGIGRETTLELLQHNARVYVASRSKTKFDHLSKEWEEELKGNTTGSLQFLKLDLSDLKSCIMAAKQFTDTEKRLDAVIANAALSVMPCTLSRDGIEIQFATNHLGHFAFIYNLLDLVKQTSVQFGEARIVMVASHAHSLFRPVSPAVIDFDDLKTEGTGSIQSLAEVQASLQRYARSKLANILFARALHKHVVEAGYPSVFVNSLNPGTIGTSSGTESASIPDGARTPLFLATDPLIATQKLSGRYFDVGPVAGKFWYGYTWDATEFKLSDAAKDAELAERLWVWSENMIASV